MWEVRNGRFTPYEGDWGFYERTREGRAVTEEAAPVKETAQTKSSVKAPSRWQLGRDLEGLEGRIEELEAELGGIAAQLETPETLSAQELVSLSESHGRLEAELLTAMARWEEVSVRLEV